MVELKNTLNSINQGMLFLEVGKELIYINQSAFQLLGGAGDKANFTLENVAPNLKDFLSKDWDKISEDFKGNNWKSIKMENGKGSARPLFINISRPEAQKRIVLLRGFNSQAFLDDDQTEKLNSLGMLAGGIAHHYNNLLMVVSGYLSRASRSYDDLDRVKNAITKATEATDRATNVSQQLMIFSGKHAREPKRVNLTKTIKELLPDLEALLTSTTRLRLELSTEDCLIKTDIEQFAKSMESLVSNSVFAMPTGGEIVIGSKLIDVDEGSDEALKLGLASGKYISIFVRDQGVGLNASAQKHLFDPFFSTKKGGGSSGMGLSVVYGFMKANEGKIQAMPVEGGGVEITLFFKVLEKAPLAVKNNRIKDLPQGNGQRILVVDDEEEIVNLVTDDLQYLGYKTIEALNGFDALELEESFEGDIDLLLTDVVMPEFTGPEIARAILENRPNIKVIFMSGYAPQQKNARTRLPDNAEFISKPMKLSSLANIVKTVLEGKECRADG